jgi:hypothetical protein
MQSNLPEEALRDLMAPPRSPIEVLCIHCGQTFDSARIEWREHQHGNRRRGFWCCPMPDCDGMGFGFDIWPVDPSYRDERTGELMCIPDADDDEELAAADIISDLGLVPGPDSETAADIAHDLAVIETMLADRTPPPERPDDRAPAASAPGTGPARSRSVIDDWMDCAAAAHEGENVVRLDGPRDADVDSSPPEPEDADERSTDRRNLIE